MPRRAPPTSLRLVQGPVPPRSLPRHTLPSVPRPTFSQPAMVARGPTPRQQPSSLEDPFFAAKFADLPEIIIPPNSSLPSSVLSATSPYEPRKPAGPLGPFRVDLDAAGHGEPTGAFEACCIGIVRNNL
ncbi:hypothetical protein B0H11DRAFT_402990 [Mycena galericulata]|nr:hypothetical protein B0H11DRAFT_402990 [Mycena galericulata]